MEFLIYQICLLEHMLNLKVSVLQLVLDDWQILQILLNNFHLLIGALDVLAPRRHVMRKSVPRLSALLQLLHVCIQPTQYLHNCDKLVVELRDVVHVEHFHMLRESVDCIEHFVGENRGWRWIRECAYLVT